MSLKAYSLICWSWVNADQSLPLATAERKT